MSRRSVPLPEPLTYGPAYLGLYACLTLGVACNCFLDIRYGHFALEVLLWALAFALTLFLGWRQQGQAGDAARGWQKGVLAIAGVLFLLIFLPIWGLPRAGLYLLCGLQAAQNCITTSRRHFYLGLLVSAVLVLFAAAHPRADWTMLFYLLPYVLAAVLTLVAEQVARRSVQVRRQSLGEGRSTGQGLAAATAALVILALAGLFYALTPQHSWLQASWERGLPGGARLGTAPEGGAAAGQAGGGGGTGSAAARSDWPSPESMRAAARRPGMPGWQAGMIDTMADGVEWLEETFSPAWSALRELWQDFLKWLQEHRREVAMALLALLLLALLAAFWLLARETGPIAWLRTRSDYLRLGLGGRHGPGRQGARDFYRAAERLFAYYGEPRAAALGPREYGRRLQRRYPELGEELHLLTGYFDLASYSRREPREEALQAMRRAYRRVFTELTD